LGASRRSKKSRRLALRNRVLTTGAMAADPSDMSVAELKRALEMRGIDFRDAIEKQDLLGRLLQDLSDEESMGVIAKSRVDELTEAERSTVALFERCSPSVAFIQTTVAQRSGRLSLNATQEVPAGTGTGFLWDRSGHVVTNFHVIKDAINRGRAKVTLSQGTEAFDATLVGAEPDKDVAVLKVDAPPEEVVPIDVGSSADLMVGQSVIAIGNPFGLDNTLTTGVVSALGREVMGVNDRPITGCIQTDASINPGNSGGPLLDSSGRLIGVNTAIFSPSGASVGIGFAIPVDTVRRLVNQIIRYGRVQRASLGVQVADDGILRDLSRRVGGGIPQGVLVMGVNPDSPAERAGIRSTLRAPNGGLVVGDIILSVAGEPTAQVEDLLSAVEQRRIGDAVEVEIYRGAGTPSAEELSVRVQLEERQADIAGGGGGGGGGRGGPTDVHQRRRSRM
jgi:S1-C subfamily serine protease